MTQAHLDTLAVVSDGPVIPVIVLDRVADAVPLAQALVAGGIRMLEVTLRTPVALAAVAAIAEAVPQAVVGVGSVLDAAQARQAAAAGARFAVSPGLLPDVVDACAVLGLPLLPGVATASEVMAARACGLRVQKCFPAEAIGGKALLKAWSGPFQDVVFCPTGGIGPDNAAAYLALDNVRCVGGSWLVPPAALAAGDWASITRLAQAARALAG